MELICIVGNFWEFLEISRKLGIKLENWKIVGNFLEFLGIPRNSKSSQNWRLLFPEIPSNSKLFKSELICIVGNFWEFLGIPRKLGIQFIRVNRLFCCLIVGIQASGMLIPLSLLMLLGWSLLWIASLTVRVYQLLLICSNFYLFEAITFICFQQHLLICRNICFYFLELLLICIKILLILHNVLFFLHRYIFVYIHIYFFAPIYICLQLSSVGHRTCVHTRLWKFFLNNFPLSKNVASLKIGIFLLSFIWLCVKQVVISSLLKQMRIMLQEALQHGIIKLVLLAVMYLIRYFQGV